jgi:hypothetical protein
MNAAILMRNFTVLMACQLLGTACAPPMEQLIKEAHDTGDWSQVELRQDVELKRQARRTPMCEDGLVSVCSGLETVTKQECVCVQRATMRRAYISNSR